MCMGRRKPCCNHWNSFTHVSTSCERRAWPMPWLAFRDSIQAMPSGAPTFPLEWGWSLSAPWCFKLGGNTEAIAIHLWEVHYQMAIVYDICQMFAGMSTQNVLNHQVRCKAKHNEEHVEYKGHKKAQKSHKNKNSKSQGQKGVFESLRSDATKKSCWAEFHSMPFLLPTSQPNEGILILSLNHSE